SGLGPVRPSRLLFSRVTSRISVAVGMLPDLLDLLLQLSELLGQVHDLDGPQRVVEDAQRRPDLRPGVAAPEVTPEGADRGAGGLLQPGDGALDHLTAGLPVPGQELRLGQPVAEGPLRHPRLLGRLLDGRHREQGSEGLLALAAALPAPWHAPSP